MKRFPAFSLLASFLLAVFCSMVVARVPHPFSSISYHQDLLAGIGPTNFDFVDEPGIKEIVPASYQPRYQKWKQEFLATEYGRSLWSSYADRKDFSLTIKVVGNRKFGAGTDDFKWDESGRLIAATITLGKNLDSGFPDPVYYPVMNSLATFGGVYAIGDGVLASTKLAHEIGHVSYTAETNSSLFQKQNKLMESYYSIFLKNGFNTRDARLVSLQVELGAQPIEIWEDREYWSEVTALKYLVERMDSESIYCAVMKKIKQNVSSHAQNYRDRFDVSKFGSRTTCGS